LPGGASIDDQNPGGFASPAVSKKSPTPPEARSSHLRPSKTKSNQIKPMNAGEFKKSAQLSAFF
jgi:hypothetical protein